MGFIGFAWVEMMKFKTRSVFITYRCQCGLHELVADSKQMLVRRHTRLNQHHHWPIPTLCSYQLHHEYTWCSSLCGNPLWNWLRFQKFVWESCAAFADHEWWCPPVHKIKQNDFSSNAWIKGVCYRGKKLDFVLPLGEIEPHKYAIPHCKCQQWLDLMTQRTLSIGCHARWCCLHAWAKLLVVYLEVCRVSKHHVQKMNKNQ